MESLEEFLNFLNLSREKQCYECEWEHCEGCDSQCVNQVDAEYVRKRAQVGFTLLELIVSVTIVSVLTLVFFLLIKG